MGKEMKNALDENLAKKVRGITVGIEIMTEDVRMTDLETDAERGKPKTIHFMLLLTIVPPRLLAS